MPKSGQNRTIGLAARGRQSLKNARTQMWLQLMHQLTNLHQTKAAVTVLAKLTLSPNMKSEVALLPKLVLSVDISWLSWCRLIKWGHIFHGPNLFSDPSVQNVEKISWFGPLSAYFWGVNFGNHATSVLIFGGEMRLAQKVSAAKFDQNRSADSTAAAQKLKNL